MKFLFRKKIALWGLVLFGGMLIASVAGPWLTPHGPDTQTAPAENRFLPPSTQHWFGTDQYGRDVFARVLVGGRLSLGISLSVVLVALLLGSLYGAIAGYMGGIWDTILMRILDMLLSFPFVFLAITCMALFGVGLFYLILILSLTSWMDVARLVRAEVHSLKNQPLTLRARASGFRPLYIIIRHLIPNTVPTLVAVAVVRVADIILIESSLSFLGLGVQPPMASWGSIINDGRMVMTSAWWVALFPGLAILVTTTSLNFIGDGLKARNKDVPT